MLDAATVAGSVVGVAVAVALVAGAAGGYLMGRRARLGAQPGPDDARAQQGRVAAPSDFAVAATNPMYQSQSQGDVGSAAGLAEAGGVVVQVVDARSGAFAVDNVLGYGVGTPSPHLGASNSDVQVQARGRPHTDSVGV